MPATAGLGSAAASSEASSGPTTPVSQSSTPERSKKLLLERSPVDRLVDAGFNRGEAERTLKFTSGDVAVAQGMLEKLRKSQFKRSAASAANMRSPSLADQRAQLRSTTPKKTWQPPNKAEVEQSATSWSMSLRATQRDEMPTSAPSCAPPDAPSHQSLVAPAPAPPKATTAAVPPLAFPNTGSDSSSNSPPIVGSLTPGASTAPSRASACASTGASTGTAVLAKGLAASATPSSPPPSAPRSAGGASGIASKRLVHGASTDRPDAHAVASNRHGYRHAPTGAAADLALNKQLTVRIGTWTLGHHHLDSPRSTPLGTPKRHGGMFTCDLNELVSPLPTGRSSPPPSSRSASRAVSRSASFEKRTSRTSAASRSVSPPKAQPVGHANDENDEREGDDGEPPLNALGLDFSTLVQPLAAVEAELAVVEEFLTPRGQTPIKKGGARSKAAFFEQWQNAALDWY